MNKIRLGISMRIMQAQNYYEPRDALALDWASFLLKNLSEVEWMYIPNIKNDVVEYVKKWGLNTFILSGGEDMGTDIERDETERKLLKYALENNFKILGVCRGLQLIYDYFGGKVITNSKSTPIIHRAKSHYIRIEGKSREVNSYHVNVLNSDAIPSELKPLAFCEDDQSIEAVTGKNLLAIMWHPEREKSQSDEDVRLIRNFLITK